MRISILPPGGSPLVLGDDSQRLWLSCYLPKVEWSVQVSQLFRSASVKVYPRLNQRWTLTFQVDRTFNQSADALAFLLDYPASVPTQGTLEVFQAERRRFFKNATLSELRVLSVVGVTVQLAYTFTAESTSTSL